MARRLAPSIWLCTALCFSVLISQGCGGGGSSSSSSKSSSSAITVTVSPSNSTIAPGGNVQFTATVTGSSNTSVTWNVNGTTGGNSSIGTISGSGLYTAPAAPPSPSTVTINAVSQADSTKSGSASLVVQAHHVNQDPQGLPIKLGTGGGNSTDTSTETVNGQVNQVCCSGTLGSLVSRGGNLYILSNNHVLDRSNQGKAGDPISQPGLADENCRTTAVTTVAQMSQAVTLNALDPNTHAGSSSLADAAIAKIMDGAVDTTGSILELRATGQPAPPSATLADPSTAISQPVAKSGDASGLTCSVVNSISTAVQVDYCKMCMQTCTAPNVFTARFDRQIVVAGGSFSTNGDSGSLIVTQDAARPLSLLYAGGTTNTVGNPIQDVLSALSDPNTSEVPKVVGGGDHPVSCPASTQSQVGTAADSANAGTQNLTDAEVTRAASVKTLHASQLMRDSSISRIEVGSSADAPNEAALIIHAASRLQQPLPNVVEGVRTRIVMDSQRASAIEPISGTELLRGQTAKSLHVEELMANPAIIGVGVGASNDAPGQSAVVVYVEQGKTATVPAEVDGVRTRVIVTDRFRTFAWGKPKKGSCSRK